MMHKDAIMDELRRVEYAAVEGERQLAEQEALLIELRRRNENTTRVEAHLALMRKTQLDLEQNRQRLLALLQP